MPRKLSILIPLLLVLGLGAVLFVRLRREPAAESRQTAPALPATIAVSGEILGVAIGAPMNEVRAKLDPLRAPGPAYEPDQKELQGRRIYWKLSGTDYDWIMVWAGKQGNVTRVRALFQPEHRPLFNSIGDVARAVTEDRTMVRGTYVASADRTTGSSHKVPIILRSAPTCFHRICRRRSVHETSEPTETVQIPAARST